MGYCRQIKPSLYDTAYFDEYRKRDATMMGVMLTRRRIDFVERTLHHKIPEDAVDVGIGGGRFVCEGNCKGFDVNPDAVEWLKQHNRFHDLLHRSVHIATFWDSLEHIPDPGPILRRVRRWAFVSTPIYKGLNDCLASKHYKPGEHVHYWTAMGLRHFMAFHGFTFVDQSDFEVRVGRQAIGSFAFTKLPADKLHA